MSIEKMSEKPQVLSLLESMTQSMPLWFQQGGVVMWLLLLTSFLATIVTLERFFVWTVYYYQKERFPLQACFAALNKHEKTNALLACQQLDTPALNMLEHGIQSLPFSPKEKMEAYAEGQISLLSRGQSLLDTVITIAPMLGILGTVLGIIDSFNILSLQGVDNPTAVVGGIAQALISTAAGLSIALLALLPYNLFRSWIQKLTLHLENVGSEFNHLCRQHSLITNQPNSNEQKNQSARTVEEEKAEIAPVSSHQTMPYHYDFSTDTGEVNVNLHAETEAIQRTSQDAIAQMYDDPSTTVAEASRTKEAVIDEVK